METNLLQQNKQQITGFVASSFDILHPGHCLMLKDAKEHCDFLYVALQDDPQIDRPEKNKPIMTLNERYIILSSIKYIDHIIPYKTENDLLNILKYLRPDIRILGSDYKDKQDKIVGKEYCKLIYFHNRDHNWSSSYFRDKLKTHE